MAAPAGLPKSAGVVIVGGGVVGASTAFQLTRRGVTPLLLERRQLGAGASGKSGALVRVHYANTHEAQLTLRSLEVFRNWNTVVGHGSPGFVEQGFLQVVAPADEAKLRANVAALRGVGANTWVVDPGELREIDPLMRTDDITCAAYEPESGYCDPNGTLYGFAAAAEAGGATIATHVEVTAIDVTGGRVRAVETSAGRVATERVLVAAGAWANSLLGPLGIDIGLVPRRLQVAVFRHPPDMPEGLSHRVVIDASNHSWMRPEGLNGTLIGAERQTYEGDPDTYSQSIDAPAIDDARAALTNRYPVFEHATMRGGWAGIIMASPDSHPILDAVPGMEGAWVFTGDSGTSFKTSPATGAILADWMTEGGTAGFDVHPFRVTRFAEGRPWVDETGYAAMPLQTVSR
jgi:sarcosine oxidase subunit beta